ncbi:TetR/AcrR family transcriptional regulator [Micromonospora sp. ATA32]|nr:TetR/AcrR family transcriptional regulator [Micromonospora sp. ATA32]
MSTSDSAPRDRIVRAAAELLTRGGRDAVSTRAVSRAAGVQAPTIYRQFGDLRGLLDAASYGFAAYLHAKAAREPAPDPVDDLRHGWDMQVEFGVANPAFHTLMYGAPHPGVRPTAARVAADILRQLVCRVAEAGRLRVGVDRRGNDPRGQLRRDADADPDVAGGPGQRAVDDDAGGAARRGHHRQPRRPRGTRPGPRTGRPARRGVAGGPARAGRRPHRRRTGAVRRVARPADRTGAGHCSSRTAPGTAVMVTGRSSARSPSA